MSKVYGGKLSGGLLIGASVALFTGAILYAIFNDMDYGLSIAVAVTLVLVLALYIVILPVKKISSHIRDDRDWVEYKTKSGETLTEIAKKNKIAWRKLVKINGLKAPYDLVEGQLMKVPLDKALTPEPKITITEPEEIEEVFEEVPKTIEEEALDTPGLDEPNMLQEIDEPESVDEIFEDDIPQEEIAAELAHKPRVKKKSPPKKKSGPRKIAVKPKK